MVGAPLKGDEPMFTILEEEMQHQRYLTLYNRKVKFPSTPEHPEVLSLIAVLAAISIL